MTFIQHICQVLLRRYIWHLMLKNPDCIVKFPNNLRGGRIKHNMPLRQVCGNSLSEQLVFVGRLLGVPIENQCRTAWCSHKLCGNSAVLTRIVGTKNWFPIGCSDKFVGTTVPTKIVGTPNGGFLLAVLTNLSEQYTFYNAAYCKG